MIELFIGAGGVFQRDYRQQSWGNRAPSKDGGSLKQGEVSGGNKDSAAIMGIQVTKMRLR